MVMLYSFSTLSISSAVPSIFLPSSRISWISNHVVQDYIFSWWSSCVFSLIFSPTLDSQLCTLIFQNSIFLSGFLSTMLFHFFPPQSDGKKNRMMTQTLLDFFSSPSTCYFPLVSFWGFRLCFSSRTRILFHIFNHEVFLLLNVDLKNTNV